MMVAARRRTVVEEPESVVLDIVEEESRPTGGVQRGRWANDPRVAALVEKALATAETGGSLKVKLVDPKLLEQLAMHVRHHVVTKGKYKLRTQRLPDGYMRLYAEKNA